MVKNMEKQRGEKYSACFKPFSRTILFVSILFLTSFLCVNLVSASFKDAGWYNSTGQNQLTDYLNTDMLGYWNFKIDGEDTFSGVHNCTGTNTNHFSIGGVLNDGYYNFTAGDGSNNLTCLSDNLRNKNNLTIMAWVRTDTNGSDQNIVTMPYNSIADAGNDFAWYLWEDPNQPSYWFKTDAGISGTSDTDTLVINEWEFIAYTWNGTDKCDYKNGTLLACNSLGGIININSAGEPNLTIGTGADRPYVGGIDEVAVWNRSLNSTEIADLWNSGEGISFLKVDEFFTENSQVFNSTTTEGARESFVINITYNSTAFTNIQGRLFYNGTFNTGTKTGSGDNVQFVSTISIPTVASDISRDFSWEMTFINESSYISNSTIQSQSIKDLAIDDCTANSVLIYNFSLVDEQTQTLLNGATYNTTVEIDLQVYPIGDRTSAIINFSQNYSENNNPQICMENLNTTYEVDAEIRYNGDDYADELYYIQNQTLVNTTIPNNINLFDLKDASSQEFVITFKDSSFIAVQNALIQIQRKYINEGIFKTVEQPKTDADGEVRGHLQLDGAVYTIVVLKEGSILATFDDIVPVCQNPSLQTCEINLNSFATSIQPDDFTVGDDFSFTLTFEPSTRTIQTIFSIPSGGSSAIILNVTLFDNIGSTQACADSITSSSGTLSCVVPSNLGNGTAVTTITKSGVVVGKAFISLEQEPEDLYGNNLVFLGLIVILTLVGAGLSDNPMILGVFLLLGSMLLIAFNLIDTGISNFIGGGATFLWLVIAIVIVLIKGSKRS